MESKYLQDYLRESKEESGKKENPPWLQAFFKDFYESLNERVKNPSPGDRNIVTSSFKRAFGHLVPDGLKWNPEEPFKKLIKISGTKEVDKMLAKKRVDFVVYGKEKTVLIEFKTNLQFNDLAAAMIEMGAVRKYEAPPEVKQVITSSMHLFPYRANIAGLKELNEMFGSPLDNIWVFCQGPELKFNVQEIEEFRNVLAGRKNPQNLT